MKRIGQFSDGPLRPLHPETERFGEHPRSCDCRGERAAGVGVVHLGDVEVVVLLRPDVQTEGASVHRTDHFKPFRVTPEDLERFFLEDTFLRDVQLCVAFGVE